MAQTEHRIPTKNKALHIKNIKTVLDMH